MGRPPLVATRAFGSHRAAARGAQVLEERPDLSLLHDLVYKFAPTLMQYLPRATVSLLIKVRAARRAGRSEIV
jgi:hypothetical protein